MKVRSRGNELGIFEKQRLKITGPLTGLGHTSVVGSRTTHTLDVSWNLQTDT